MECDQSVTAGRSDDRWRARGCTTSPGAPDSSTESPPPPVASRSRSRSRTRPVRPTPKPSRSRSSRPPTITTEALSSGTVGEFYCCGNLFASGGVQPYTWSVVAGTLPPGLTLPKGENTISGTPTTAGTFTFTVSHRRSGRLQREGVLHHDQLSVQLLRGSRRHHGRQTDQVHPNRPRLR
jgi:hypothetical protein